MDYREGCSNRLLQPFLKKQVYVYNMPQHPADNRSTEALNRYIQVSSIAEYFFLIIAGTRIINRQPVSFLDGVMGNIEI